MFSLSQEHAINLKICFLTRALEEGQYSILLSSVTVLTESSFTERNHTVLGENEYFQVPTYTSQHFSVFNHLKHNW